MYIEMGLELELYSVFGCGIVLYLLIFVKLLLVKIGILCYSLNSFMWIFYFEIMKKLIVFFFIGFVVVSCGNVQFGLNVNISLDVVVFYQQLKEYLEVIVIDVCMLEEFWQGYIENVVNYNWNDDFFDSYVVGLDKL